IREIRVVDSSISAYSPASVSVEVSETEMVVKKIVVEQLNAFEQSELIEKSKNSHKLLTGTAKALKSAKDSGNPYPIKKARQSKAPPLSSTADQKLDSAVPMQEVEATMVTEIVSSSETSSE